MYAWVGAGRIDSAAEADTAVREVHRDEHVVEAPQEGDRINESAARVGDRRAGDSGRVDVAARERAAAHRRAEVPAPAELPGRGVERVQRVVLGRDDDL